MNVTVAVQGFGKVGAMAALLLAEAGCRVIAVSDVGGDHDVGGVLSLGREAAIDVLADLELTRADGVEEEVVVVENDRGNIGRRRGRRLWRIRGPIHRGRRAGSHRWPGRYQLADS